MKKVYLVAYDIRNARRLRHIAKCCLNVGVRLQKSLYLCTMTEATLEWFWRELRGLIDASEDQLMITPLCKSCIATMRVSKCEEKIESQPLLYVI